MQRRTVGLIAVMSLASGWLTSTIVSPDAQPPAAADLRGPRPLGSAAPSAPYTQQLKLKLQEHPRSPSPGRNPFVFGARRSDGAAAASRTPELEPPAPELPMEPSAPSMRFELSGMATSRQDGADVFTAIVNDNGSLAFVKAGDKLSNGYSVVRVDETSIVIADPAGVEQVLRLK